MDATQIGILGAIAFVLGEIMKRSIWPDGKDESGKPFDNPNRRYLPLVLVPIMALLGFGYAYAVAGDYLAGAVNGFFAGALASGVYEFGKAGVAFGGRLK